MLKPTVGGLPGSEWRLRRTSPRRQWCKGDRTSRYPSLLLSPFLGEESLHSWESGSLFAVLNGGVCVCVCLLCKHLRIFPDPPTSFRPKSVPSLSLGWESCPPSLSAGSGKVFKVFPQPLDA